MSQTILVVDDKANVRILLREYLTEQGYEVLTAENGRHALSLTQNHPPDLVLLDVMMPEMDGYEFIQQYRRTSETPIILLTAKLEETDKIIGLELGADDYITKPFSMREVLARVRAVLRRTYKDIVQDDILTVSNISLNRTSRQVMVNNEDISLTPSEFDLLTVLMTTPGRAFSRTELLEVLQGVAISGAERTVNVHVRNLRTKIEPDPSDPTYIETVFGIGYRFRKE